MLFIFICLFGAFLSLLWRRIGLAVVFGSSLSIFVTAMPAFSSFLTHQLESEIPNDVDLSPAQAIVVLGADAKSAEGEASDRLGPLSLERLIFATDAYRHLHLPVIVSGGPVGETQTSVAALMRTTLEGYFGVPVTWTEDQSRTTYENAVYTARLLETQHIAIVVLVSQARDLPRALWSFERAGLRALPWPTPRTAVGVTEIKDFLPNATAFHESFFALHELVGGFYYRLRYWAW